MAAAALSPPLMHSATLHFGPCVNSSVFRIKGKMVMTVIMTTVMFKMMGEMVSGGLGDDPRGEGAEIITMIGCTDDTVCYFTKGLITEGVVNKHPATCDGV